MNKLVAFDFFQIETAENQPSFSSILDHCSGVEPLEARVKNVGGRILRLETLRKESRLYVGDIIKLRMDELPGVASVSTPRTDLNLKTDQGITEETAFAYDPVTKTLIMQRNFYGTAATVLVQYLAELAVNTAPIGCNLVVSEEGFQRLESMEVVKKISFRVARPQRGTIMRASNQSVGSALSLLDDMGAMQVEMAISVGRFRTELTKTKVVSMVRDLLRLHAANAESVDRVAIAGVTEDDTRDAFDLLEYRLRSYQTVPIDPVRRTMTASSRINAVIRAFRDQGEALARLLQ